MSRINVEKQALQDPRFLNLGKRLRCPDRFAHDAGLGIMIRIWDHMTEFWSEEAGRAAYEVTAKTLADLFARASYGARLGVEITNVGLAEETNIGSGVFRIKGTLGRIEWLNRARERARTNGMKGGRKPTSVSPLAPALAPAPAPSTSPESPPESLKNETPTETASSLQRPQRRSRPPRLIDASGAVMSFPTAGDPPAWTLTTMQVDIWQGLYPKLDVLAECKKAHAWIDANAMKTARGMPRFLVSWFNRSNDNGRSGNGSVVHHRETLADRNQRVIDEILTRPK